MISGSVRLQASSLAEASADTKYVDTDPVSVVQAHDLSVVWSANNNEHFDFHDTFADPSNTIVNSLGIAPKRVFFEVRSVIHNFPIGLSFVKTINRLAYFTYTNMPHKKADFFQNHGQLRNSIGY